MKQILSVGIIILFYTNNGFATWVKQTSGTTNDLYDVWFKRPPSGRGWAVGKGGVIISTQNLGTNWIAQNSGTNLNLYGIAWDSRYFFTKEWASAVGGDQGNGIVIHTTNSGNNWVVKGSPNYEIYATSFADSLNGWAVGAGGTVWRTTDGGLNWSYLITTLRVNWYGVWFVDRMVGWKCGTNGAIMKTTSGGLSWTTQNSGTTDTLRGICFKDTLTGCAVGKGGLILRTTDGGAGWTRISTGYTDDLYDIYFSYYGSIGYAVGANGRILATSNSGQTWQAEVSGVNLALRGVWCWLDLPGIWAFAVGDSGTILYQFIPEGIEEDIQATRLSEDCRILTVNPNPFKKKMFIKIENLNPGEVAALKIYSLGGELIHQFEVQSLQGRQTFVWDGKDGYGRPVPDGVYFIRLEAESITITRPILHIR